MHNSFHPGHCTCRQCATNGNDPTILEELLTEAFELPQQLDGTKLSGGNKDAFRSQAQRGRDKISKWRIRCAKLRAQGKDCHIHHIIPLQYIHLFKGRNPNRTDNVVLVSDEQHKNIHAKLRFLIKKARNNEERKKILEAFRKGVLRNRYYANAKVPDSFKQPLLKELFKETNL
jgi:hypothetical protein